MYNIKVKIQIDVPEDLIDDINSSIKQNFIYDYDNDTKIIDVLEYANVKSNSDVLKKSKYYVAYKNEMRFLRSEAKLFNLIEQLDCKETLEINLVSGIGNVVFPDKKNGLVYFVHSNEASITPHIHVKYSGEEISIDLKTFEVTNSFKSPTKQKRAIKYVKENQQELIEKYSELTNGLIVEGFEIDL